MEKIVSLCKRRGFIFQSSEIYGGINGFWDYGPLGAELKRNVREAWWHYMTREREDVVGLDATIIMHPKVWEASGHTTTFADPMVDCLLTKKRFRADQIEPQGGVVSYYLGAIDRYLLDAVRAGYQTHQAAPPEQQPVWHSALASLFERLPELLTTPRNSAEIAVRRELDVPATTRLLEQALGAFTKHHPELLAQGGIHSTTAFSVLVPTGKGEKHRRNAARYYFNLGLRSPLPISYREEPVTQDTRFCSEEDCGSELTPARQFNLMFKTYVGPLEDAESIAYLRPETAQAIFAQFKNVLEVSRQKVPFGICQIGKAFRNEINPRNFTFRSREFEQMELEFFIRPDEVAQKLAGSVARVADHPALTTPQPSWGWEVWHKYWVEERIKWYESIGLSRDSLEAYWQKKEELAHYAKATVDILYKFPFGTQELEGVAARGDFDLTQHQKFSGKSMEWYDEEAKAKYVPHVIEPSAGVDRLVLALICHAYCEDTAPDEKGKLEQRVVMKFHPRIAPIKVGVFPLLKNRPELVQKAREVRDRLRPHMTVFYDEAGAIGRRYRRQDEAGTPFGVTIDFDTLGERPELKDSVTLRDRDTMQQIRVKIDELVPLLLPKTR